MALFDLNRSQETDEVSGTDTATRALSVTAVETDFVASVYARPGVVLLFLGALEQCLQSQGCKVTPGAGVAAANAVYATPAG